MLERLVRKEGDSISLRINHQNKAASLRNQLVDQLVAQSYIRSKKVEDAFRKVPRHLFLPNFELQEVYSDGSIITKRLGLEPISSSTAPSLMASMLEILHLRKGMKVLEIGTGTGYNAAILAELAGDEKKVFSVDIDAETVQDARQNLTEAGYKHITIKCGDGAKGFTEQCPYDRIIVTSSVRDIPKALVDQLKEGGIIVLPIWINGSQITPALQKKGGTLIGLYTTLGGFMDLRVKTHKEMLTASPEQTSNKGLLICSEHPELFNERAIELLLKRPHEEKSLPSRGILPPRGSNFFIFLSLRERKSVELFLEGDTNEFGFGDSAAGIIDLDNNSACLISRDNKLLVYGNLGTYRRILSLAGEWDNLKRPGLERLQVFAYMQDQIPKLKRDDVLLEEKSPALVIRIL